MESVARAALLSHFSDLEKELQLAHDNNTQLRGELLQQRNRNDTLQAQVDGLQEYFEGKIADLHILTDQLARSLSEHRDEKCPFGPQPEPLRHHMNA